MTAPLQNSRAPRSIFRRVLFTLAVAVVALPLIGIGLRLAAGVYHRLNPAARPAIEAIDRDVLVRGEACDAWYPPDSVIWCLRRGYERELVRVNSAGFFGPEIGPADPERTRIVVLGGSTSAGVAGDPLRYGWPEYLAEELEGRAPDRFEVINGAITGYASRDLRVRYFLDVRGEDPRTGEPVGRDLRPDVLILYTGWNDLGAPLLRPGRYDALHTFMIHGDPAVLEGSDDPWLREQVDLWSAFRDFEVERVRGSLAARARSGLRESEAAAAMGELVGEIEVLDELRTAVGRPHRLILHPDQSLSGPSPFDREGYDDPDFRDNIEAIVAHATAAGTEVVLVLPPHGFGCGEIHTYRHPGRVSLRPRDRLRHLTRFTWPTLTEIAQSHDARILSHPRLDPDTPGRCAYFEDEMHLDPDGLRLIAHHTADELASVK